MSLQHIFLLFHLIGAVLFFLHSVMIVFHLVKNNHNHFKNHTKTLLGAFSFQVITGSLLTLLTPHVSLFEYCVKIGIYISIFAGLETLLVIFIIQKNKKTHSVLTIE